MSETKWTPGPWELADKYNCTDVRAVDGPYVADCNASAAIDWRTKEANARLIAAAPELYEALENLRKLYDTDEGCRSMPEYQAAIAALAKARGEQP